MRHRNIYIAGLVLLGFVLLTLVFGLASCDQPNTFSLTDRAIKAAETWKGIAEEWEIIAIENGKQRDEAIELLTACTKGERP